MAIIVILCGAPHLYKKDMNNSGLILSKRICCVSLSKYAFGSSIKIISIIIERKTFLEFELSSNHIVVVYTCQVFENSEKHK